ncbi:AMP binding protein [Leucosporidium creatinivorum]|uniref:AMP binding protein n=1 Tax=Leucosporidium creatinivorum TaxID=106004 RepID=A0A1Y2G5M8_9BASI|nr:AMP binding protein [Leucosporidium creatinivorum]
MTIHTSPWPAVDLPECSVWDLVWSNPNNVPDAKPAVIDGASGRVWTRSELKTAAQQVAYGYRNTLGLQPGQVVCLFSPNSFYYHLLVIATQCAGCVFSGANAAYTPKELEHQLGDSTAAVVLCHPSVLETALAATRALGWSKQKQREKIVLAVQRDETGPAGDIYKCLNDIMTKVMPKPHHIANPKETVAFLGYSSGTSGKAKGVRTSAYNMTSVLSILKPLDITRDDVHLAVLPLNHIYGLTKLTVWPIVQGQTVVVMPKFELAGFCSLVERYKVSVILLVPPIALLLARDPIVDNYNMSSLKLVISGAAPLGPELERDLAKRLKTNVTQAYGLTESSPTTHYCPISSPSPGSIGPLLPMMKGRICDPETGEDVKEGEQGEMLLQGPNIMLGYLNRPEANAETLYEDKDGIWLKTGDIAWVDKRGFYYITDRLKELIKYKGLQIAPAELEGTLLDCPYVADAAVIGVWVEAQATELPRAYVVPSAEGKKQMDPAKAIREWVDGKVSNHKKLRGGVRLVESVPKSPSGKLLRRILREEAKREEEREAPMPLAKL